ncbi:hypothetical protein [Paenibacillus thermotolerans]|uniref:hypothetical protein n=1 Tax=Paenibacillus thermotolerans TaxID=3027807 RepID=UPI002368DFE4|nr:MULTISPECIES: hypothetical protein [unclassified Paenibacillus]
MKRKALTLTCAVSMALTLLAGCGGTNDTNNDGVENFGVNSASGATRKRGVEPERPRDTLDLNDDRTRGDGDRGDRDRIFAGYSIESGVTGSTDATGTLPGQGRNGMGTLGGPLGALGLASLLADRDTLVIGNTVIVGRDERTDSVSRYSLDFGPTVTILEVTEPKAIEAIDRVKTKLNRNSEGNGMQDIASDIDFILRQAKPMKSRAAQAGNNR